MTFPVFSAGITGLAALATKAVDRDYREIRRKKFLIRM
jgi:hypothetical protein